MARLVPMVECVAQDTCVRACVSLLVSVCACVCVSCVRAVACCPLLLVEEVAVHYHYSRENPGGYSIKVAYNGLLHTSRGVEV